MREVWVRARTLLATAVLAAACGTSTRPGDGSETNFVRCSQNTDCPGGRCIEGRCEAVGDAVPGLTPDGALDASRDASPDAGHDSAARLRGDGGLEVLGRAGPLGAPLAFAFKAGFHDNEQIWLRGDEGALLRISTWEVDPRYADTCGFGWSTSGYRDGFGRFGPLQLVRGEELLLFTESLACDHGAQSYPSRVLAHDLASGETRVLLETDARPNIVVSEQTAVVLLRRVPLTSPSQAAQPGDVQLYELVDGALAPISLPDVDRWLRLQLSPPARLLRWIRTRRIPSGWPASPTSTPRSRRCCGSVPCCPSSGRGHRGVGRRARAIARRPDRLPARVGV